MISRYLELIPFSLRDIRKQLWDMPDRREYLVLRPSNKPFLKCSLVRLYLSIWFSNSGSHVVFMTRIYTPNCPLTD